jgi:hypothetical protein
LIAHRRWLLAALLPALCATLPAQTRRLDATQFVVLGEGLAAGVQDFGLRSENQKLNFASHVARQIGTILPQPLLEGPGVAVIPGMAAQPAILPNARHTVVREGFPPSLFVFNLSVPGMTLAGSISRRPSPPLVQTANPEQTLVNLILGYPALILGRGKPLWSQLEYAEQLRPTLALVCLGYHEAAEAAAAGDAGRMPEAGAFRTNLNTVLSRLRGTFSEVIVMNVPDPFDTAYFTTLDTATRYVGASPAILTRLYNIQPGDLITPAGLMAIGNQTLDEAPGALPAGSFVRAAAAQQVRARVTQINTEISQAAQSNGAILYDVNALFRQVRANGVVVNNRLLTADYLGGFYTLSGFYPGLTGHALIANGLIAAINQAFGSSFSAVNIATASAGDPALRRVQTFKRLPARQEAQR